MCVFPNASVVVFLILKGGCIFSHPNKLLTFCRNFFAATEVSKDGLFFELLIIFFEDDACDDMNIGAVFLLILFITNKESLGLLLKSFSTGLNLILNKFVLLFFSANSARLNLGDFIFTLGMGCVALTLNGCLFCAVT